MMIKSGVITINQNSRQREKFKLITLNRPDPARSSMDGSVNIYIVWITISFYPNPRWESKAKWNVLITVQATGFKYFVF